MSTKVGAVFSQNSWLGGVKVTYELRESHLENVSDAVAI